LDNTLKVWCFEIKNISLMCVSKKVFISKGIYLLFLSEESLYSSTSLRTKIIYYKNSADSNLIDFIIHVIILWRISKGTQIVCYLSTNNYYISKKDHEQCHNHTYIFNMRKQTKKFFCKSTLLIWESKWLTILFKQLPHMYRRFE